jgi:hypothetical protein
MTETTTIYTCAWQGCNATGSGWSGLYGPKEEGWMFAGNIPPDDIDGPLCPIHGAAFEEWAYFQLETREGEGDA